MVEKAVVMLWKLSHGHVELSQPEDVEELPAHLESDVRIVPGGSGGSSLALVGCVQGGDGDGEGYGPVRGDQVDGDLLGLAP